LSSHRACSITIWHEAEQRTEGDLARAESSFKFRHFTHALNHATVAGSYNPKFNIGS
jgi:hypothetical protein